MKRFVTLLATVALVIGWSARPAAGQNMVTLRAGANVASHNGGPEGVWWPNSRIGLNLGVSLLIPSPEKGGVIGGFQIGGAYSSKGAGGFEAGQISGTTTDAADISQDYFEISGLFKAEIPSEGSASFHFLAGPAVAFMVRCRTEDYGCDEWGEIPSAVDFSLIGGLGVDIGASDTRTLVLDLFYNFGLLSIYDGGHYKNRSFTIQAGVGFPIG